MKDDTHDAMYILGQGQHSVVFLQRDTLTAIKRVHLEDASSIHGVSTVVLREIHVLKSMGLHPHIIKYIGHTADDKFIRLETEFLPISLRGLMGERLTNAACRKYTKHILLGLQHCHETMSVLHRDLKPENLLIGTDGNLKLADFGLARPVKWTDTCCEDLTPGNYTPQMVTLWYRSKEVLLNMRYGPDIDLWSVACIAAEMLTGRVLFYASSEMHMLKEIDRKLCDDTRRLKDRCLIHDVDGLDLVDILLSHSSRNVRASTVLSTSNFVSGNL